MRKILILIVLLLATNVCAETGDLKVNRDLMVNGNLGVGLPSGMSPGAKLDVNGAVFISPDTAGRNTIMLTTNAANDGSILLKSNTTYTVNIQANGNSYFNGGNVGIGQISPMYKLTINGSLQAGYVILGDANNNSNNTIEFANPNTGTYTGGHINHFGSGNLSLVHGGGNVGINTTIPSAKLHVYNGQAHFESTSTGASEINSGTYALILGPLHTRTSGYYGGVAFNHLLNYQGITAYNGSPGAWIGLRLYDTPGSERDYLVFATKPGTGTSGTGNDIPVERMVIDPFGNVGIGRNPSYKLDVDGAIRSTSGGFVFPDGSSQTTAFSGTASQASYLNTSGLYYQGGSVGIGTTSLAGTLTIKAHNNGWEGGIDLLTSDGARRFRIHPEITAGYGLMLDGGGQGFSFYGGDVRFLGGNVGIGQTSPIYKTVINGSLQAGYVLLGDANNNSNNTIEFASPNSGTYTDGHINYFGSGNLSLVHGGGNVGIGTTGPVSKLSVGGTGILNAGIYGTGSVYGIYGENNGADTYGVYGKITTAGSGSAGVFGRNDGTTNGFGVRGNGFYGVYGYSSAASGYGIFCNSANAYGCGGNKVWYSTSDEKFKENISTIDGALPKIMKLRGVGFNWKSDSEKKHQHGFIAQEAVKVVPEVVGKDPDGNYTMSYGSLVPLLVEAIKEQQMQIEALNARLDALTKK